ncbi:MAG: DUF177 domain-containing protein [Acidobacteria bacterium]|nr:MAG: DUF177 domain-containing protein [Acidobacteriota bacterium]
MLITLQQLEFHPVTVSETYLPGALDFQGTEFRQAGPLKVDAEAELAGREIRVRGHVSGAIESACDRCLEQIEIPVELDFDLPYRPMQEIAREEEVEVGEDELKVGFFSGDGVNLADVVKEQVLLSVPMKMVCRPDCRGLCPVCGVNRNARECGCSSQLADSPFASLKKM